MLTKTRIFFVWCVLPAGLLSMMAIQKYVALHSGTMDLGVFIHHMFNVSVYGDWKRNFFGHVQLLVPPYSLLYFVWSSKFFPHSILVLQTFFLVLPSYWLRQCYGKTVAIAYLLYFPLWYNVLNDFHMDHLAVPLLVGFFLLAHKERYGWAVFAAISLALVKEPYALQTAACGIYLLLHNRGMSTKSMYSFLIGGGLILFGIGYFYLAAGSIIDISSVPVNTTQDGPDDTYKKLGWYLGGFAWLGTSLGEIVLSIITHPVSIIEEIVFTPRKVVYVVALLGALGFIPLLRPGVLLVAAPILAFSLLSRLESHYGLGNHYTAGLIAPIIFAFAGGLSRAKSIWVRIGFSEKGFIPVLLTGMVAAHIALAPSPIGRLFWLPKIWSYHYEAYIPTKRDRIIKHAIAEHIPKDHEIVVAVQNTVNWAPLVERRHLLLFPKGVTRETDMPVFGKGLWPLVMEWKPVIADYLVLDEKRPWFLLDKGCDWLYGKCTDKKTAAEYLEWVAKSKQVMDVVFESDGFLILRRID